MSHLSPFHRSASAKAWKLGGPLPPVLPAAKHTVAAGQDTDASCPGPGLRTGGERCISHVVPFQRSITGGTASEPAWPTAVQAAGEQPIPFSWTPPALDAGGGGGWRAPPAPFQCSASASSRAGGLSRPAAVQDAAEVQSTPCSWVSFRCGLGVGCTAHRRPSQRSARVADGTLPRSPTAVQVRGGGHETPASSLPCPRKTGLGTGWADQLVPSQCSASGNREVGAVVNCQPTA